MWTDLQECEQKPKKETQERSEPKREAGEAFKAQRFTKSRGLYRFCAMTGPLRRLYIESDQKAAHFWRGSRITIQGVRGRRKKKRMKITKALKQYTFNQILHNGNSRKHFRHSTHNKPALFCCSERQWGDTIKCVRKSGISSFLCLFFSFSLFFLFFILFASCFIVAAAAETLVIERYRTCALPARRWQMDYKNFKAERLEHQGRDARYLNYRSLPRRQWLPDMMHTSRNRAAAAAAAAAAAHVIPPWKTGSERKEAALALLLPSLVFFFIVRWCLLAVGHVQGSRRGVYPPPPTRSAQSSGLFKTILEGKNATPTGSEDGHASYNHLISMIYGKGPSASPYLSTEATFNNIRTRGKKRVTGGWATPTRSGGLQRHRTERAPSSCLLCSSASSSDGS